MAMQILVPQDTAGLAAARIPGLKRQTSTRVTNLLANLFSKPSDSYNAPRLAFEVLRLAHYIQYVTLKRTSSILVSKLSKSGFTYCPDSQSVKCVDCSALFHVDQFSGIADNFDDAIHLLECTFDRLATHHQSECSLLAENSDKLQKNVPFISSQLLATPPSSLDANTHSFYWEAMAKEINESSKISREELQRTLNEVRNRELILMQRTLVSSYSRSVKLIYFLAPAHNAILTETYSDIRARSREVRYERNQLDSQEQEAYAHRSEYARWRSFFDDVGNTRSYSTTSSTQDQYFSWGRSMLLAYYLAKLGFYYAPKQSQNSPLRDKIRCAFCKRGKMGWWLYNYRESLYSVAHRASDLEVAIAMWKWHRSKSPTCPTVIDLAVDSLSFESRQKSELNLLLMQPFIPIQLSQHEANIVSFRGGSGASSSFSTDSGFSSESSRMRSLENNSSASRRSLPAVYWPLNELQRISSAPSYNRVNDELVLDESEESYTPHQAASIEASCFEPLVVHNASEHLWMEKNNQAIEYTLVRPEFDARISTLTKDLLRYPLFNSLHAREMSYYRRTSTDQLDDTERLVNDSFYTLENLIASGLEPGHDAWRTDKPSPHKLAAAGFFATLRGDQVLCYCCGLALAQLRTTDNCWVEHAHHSPECAHVLAHRGVAFVREVLQRYDAQFSSASWISSTYSDKSGFFPTITRRVEPRDYRARPEVPLFRAISEECGLNPILFAYAIESEMRRTGKDFANCIELVEAVHELETRMQLVRVFDAREFVRLCNIEADAISRGVHPSQRTAEMTAQQEGMEAEDSAMQIPAPANAEELGDRRTTCTVCLDQPLEVAFVPCGHLATCFECSTRLTDCPVCRTVIRGTMRVRM